MMLRFSLLIIIESEDILSWKGPMWITESKSWLHTNYPKSKLCV